MLFLTYLATLAPGLTPWDAGEFAAAVHSFGIPHPPGTPLYIALGRAWSLLLPGVETVLAMNLLSAVATASAMAVLAMLVARALGSAAAGAAAGVGGGLMATVWLSATETEVYALSLLLAMVTLAAAERAGRGSGDAEPRHLVLTAFLFALAPAVHLTALVAAPAAITLVAMRAGGGVRWSAAALLTGAALVVWGAGTVHPVGIVAGAIVIAAATRTPSASHGRTLSVVVVGLSALAIMLVRARFDPAVNQGDPSTVSRWLDVIARHQYSLAPLWPRQAPVWLQVGNLVQYADWQVALGVDPAVGASWWRTPLTLAWLSLGVVGAVEHRRHDRRTWRAFMVLLACATLGVVAYLNLRAGPSYGYGILPEGTPREARERDYFFAPAFAMWGAWSGVGAVVASRRIANGYASRLFAILVLLAPVALNWRATNRRAEPRASIVTAFARLTLETQPAGGVLFVAGDNDSYPLWYEQVAGANRRDVTMVTIPLLGAGWYRAELARRAGLWPDPAGRGWRGEEHALRTIGRLALERGRPVAAGIGVPAATRRAIAPPFVAGADVERGGDEIFRHPSWRFRGLSYELGEVADATWAIVVVDTAAVDSLLARLTTVSPGATDRDARLEPAIRYLAALLACPTAVRGAPGDASSRLDSRCNYR
ncbi:MAG TPA: DUF2723 domain-containing protein [Gemmatimonadaceae bacterium]|nr:DUF2723 domain-containing protein [Gemmatimonadaceae bacterium]